MTTALKPPLVSLSDALQRKIDSRTASIGIIGVGYVGLPLALLFSEAAFQVTGFDVDPSKVEKLRRGESYICRISDSDLEAARARGFTATSNYSDLRGMDVIIICVPTPLDRYKEPDLSFITSTCEGIAHYLKAGQLIILESTTYPGTTEEVVVPTLENSNRVLLRAARDSNGQEDVFFVAFSPEREDPGNGSIDRHDVPKVVGGFNRQATDLATALYQTVFRQVVRVSSPAAAEMTKLLENIYRCVNIAMINELKLLCLRMGINIWEVIDAAKTKPFGFQAFYPGPGLGGHCIPIDPYYLSWKARQFDFQARFIELAGEVNMSMPYHVIATVADALNRYRKSLNAARILVLGVAYKKDVDDLRESPALTIIEGLQKSGADVHYHDPYVATIGKGRRYDLQLSSSPLADLDRYDCVLILTDHSSIDYADVVNKSQLVVDTRGATRGIPGGNIVYA